MTDTIKTISVSYSSMEELLKRESSMMKTLENYLNRNQDYEFYQSYISQSPNKFKLNLEIKLKDGNY